MDQIEKFIALSDPGEVGREEHNWGDRMIVQISNVFAWLFPLLMMAVVIQVLLRNFGRMDIGPGNQAWLDDLQWWIYGAAVLVGIAYAVTTNSHVRVDIFFDGFKREKQTKIEIFALAWLFLPFIILCWDMTIHYAWSSILADEGSDSPNGLHRLYLLKTFMNLSFILVGVAIWAAYVRFLARLTKPVLWKQFLFAFPATTFMVNLIIYYGAYWFIVFTTELEGRQITRHPFFDEWEFAGQEMLPTVFYAFVATAVLIGVLRLMDRSSSHEEG